RLEGVEKITVVGAVPRWHAGSDCLVELARVEPPLLARITLKKRAVEFGADLVDHHIAGRAQLGNRLSAAAEKFFGGSAVLEVETIEQIERRAIDRHRH